MKRFTLLLCLVACLALSFALAPASQAAAPGGGGHLDYCYCGCPSNYTCWAGPNWGNMTCDAWNQTYHCQGEIEL